MAMKDAAQALFTRYRLIPPAYLHHLTGDFDRFLESLGLGESWRERVLAAASLRDEEEVLDAGCGTGTLAVLLKRRYPAVQLTAVEPDPATIELARGKSAGWGVEVDFHQALGERLPFDNGSFDVAFSSLVLHHVPTEIKRQMLRELHRVLRPGGRLVVVDFAPPEQSVLRFLSAPLKMGLFEHTSDNFRGRIPELIAEAGFGEVEEVDRFRQFVVTWKARR